MVDDPTVLGPAAVARVTRQAVERAGVPPSRFRGLRHDSETLLLAEGVLPRVVQVTVGHADFGMAMVLCSHATSDMRRHAADALEAAIASAHERSA